MSGPAAAACWCCQLCSSRSSDLRELELGCAEDDVCLSYTLRRSLVLLRHVSAGHATGLLMTSLYMCMSAQPAWLQHRAFKQEMQVELCLSVGTPSPTTLAAVAVLCCVLLTALLVKGTL